MAGIFERVALILRSKAHKTLDECGDPRETLNYPYGRQLELLRKVHRDVVDMVTSHKCVELQTQRMNSEIDRCTVTAQRTLESNHENLAHEVLTRETGLTTQLQGLQNQHTTLQAEGEKLVCVSTRFQAKVDALRTRREMTETIYSMTKAQIRINEAFTDISKEMSDVGTAIQRTEDRALQLQAHASAIDELLAFRVLGGPMDPIRSDLDHELDTLASGSSVENKLVAMKTQLSGGPGTMNPQISSASTSNFPMIENTRATSNSGRQTQSFVS